MDDFSFETKDMVEDNHMIPAQVFKKSLDSFTSEFLLESDLLTLFTLPFSFCSW